MTSFTNHPDVLFQTDKPILGSVGLQARDNLVACLEGAPNAPRLAVKRSVASASNANLNITGLSGFKGVDIHGSIYRTGAVPRLQIALSDDGVNFADTELLLQGEVGLVNAVCRYSFFLDFETGEYAAEISGPATGNDALKVFSDFITEGIGSSVTTLQLVEPGSQRISAHVWAHGGASAS